MCFYAVFLSLFLFLSSPSPSFPPSQNTNPARSCTTRLHASPALITYVALVSGLFSPCALSKNLHPTLLSLLPSRCPLSFAAHARQHLIYLSNGTSSLAIRAACPRPQSKGIIHGLLKINAARPSVIFFFFFVFSLPPASRSLLHLATPSSTPRSVKQLPDSSSIAQWISYCKEPAKRRALVSFLLLFNYFRFCLPLYFSFSFLFLLLLGWLPSLSSTVSISESVSFSASRCLRPSALIRISFTGRVIPIRA